MRCLRQRCGHQRDDPPGNANRNAGLTTDKTDLTILATSDGFGVPDTIPEPATLFVMGCGAAGILRRRRRA